MMKKTIFRTAQKTVWVRVSVINREKGFGLGSVLYVKKLEVLGFGSVWFGSEARFGIILMKGTRKVLHFDKLYVAVALHILYGP